MDPDEKLLDRFRKQIAERGTDRKPGERAAIMRLEALETIVKFSRRVLTAKREKHLYLWIWAAELRDGAEAASRRATRPPTGPRRKPTSRAKRTALRRLARERCAFQKLVSDSLPGCRAIATNREHAFCVKPAFRLEASPEPESGIQLRTPVAETAVPAPRARSRSRWEHALELSVSLLLVLVTLVLTGVWFTRFVPSEATSHEHFHD